MTAACRSQREPATAPTTSEQEPLDEGNDPGWRGELEPAPALATTAKTNADKLVAEVVRELRAMTSTRYRHKTNIDEATGLFEYDCSGFVAYALFRSVPVAYAAVPVGPKGRARAEDFTRYFAALPPWVEAPATLEGEPFARVTGASSIRPGDIVAWLRPPTVEGTNTGHVLVALDKPIVLSSSSVAASIGGARELALKVVDSTESPHADDARGPSTTTGLGTGIIGLIVDANDVAIGYRWKGGESAKAHATLVAIARLR